MPQTDASFETEFVEAEIAVCITRLLVGGTLWCIAVSLVDRVAFRSSDPYVANLRLGLWLYLVEILIATYYVRYTAPASYPLVKRSAFIMAEVLRQCRDLGLYVVLNLAIRWIFLTVLTAIAIAIFGMSWLTGIAATIPSLSFAIAWLSGIARLGVPPVIRGTHLGSYMEAIAKAAALRVRAQRALAEKMADQGLKDVNPQDIQVPTIPFGGVEIPQSNVDPHFIVCGTASSGKTMVLRMLFQSLLTRHGRRRNRAIIHDAKREYLPLLVGMGIPIEDIIVLLCADSRGVAWNIAADIHDQNDAVNIVRTLIPDDQKDRDHAFFVQAARAITTQVFACLHSLSPGRWRLIDALNAMRTPETLKRVLFTTREGRETYERYFGREAEEMIGGIIATLDARFISEYETIARIWSRCEQSIALTDWIASQKILLLGYDENSAGMDRINQAIFERASRLLCALPDDPEGKADLTIIGLDEAVFLTKLPMLTELISLGRTKGIRVIFAPQDLDGLFEKYGEHRTHAILALCGNVAALRILSTRTREWAAKFFGDYEVWETDYSVSDTETYGSSSSTSHTTSSSTKKVKREAILPSEFLNLPLTNRSNGMHGFFATPAMGAWRAAIPPAWIDDHLSPSDPETPPFIKRPPHAVEPARWTPADEKRFTKPQDNDTTDDRAFDNHPSEDQEDDSDEQNGTPGKNDLPDW